MNSGDPVVFAAGDNINLLVNGEMNWTYIHVFVDWNGDKDFDEVIKQTIAVVKQKYPDVKIEGLFAWNYNNGIDYMNFSMKICDGGRNKYAVKLLETALDEEGIDCEEYFE